ncbi:hypothetical protein ABZ569_32795 [Streptomyces albus]|uniref:hypothetical protein n=1 Tax=Streptomyces albus TaxID=1888 RepID=UPI0033F19DEE
MSADGSLRPRLHNGAHDVLRAVESVHPDVWSDEERQEELLHAAELLEAATLRLAAAHFATVAPGDDRPAALRRGGTLRPGTSRRPLDQDPTRGSEW